MTESSETSEFDAIVRHNFSNSQDTLVMVAADDPRLREVTRWLLEDPDAPDPEDGHDYEETAIHIAETYSLELEDVGEAMNRCIANVYRELISV